MELYVSRQPVFDRYERITGYAIFYREAASAGAAAGADEPPLERLVVDAFLGIGYDRLTDGYPAYLRATRQMIVDGAIELLDPRRTIVEVPLECATDEVVLDRLDRLTIRGFRPAMDGTQPLAGAERLLTRVEYVRIDVQGLTADELAARAQELSVYPVRLFAQNVENRTMRDACLALGFEFFQGYDFSVPEVLVRRDISIDHLRTFQLMRKLRDLDVTNSEIEAEFRADLPLSYKLLRMVNSASVGGRGISSIGHAIRLLGRDAIYRWLALLLVTGFAENELQARVAHTALLRARLAELLAPRVGQSARAGALYITGLISVLDVLLGIPMAQIIEEMDLGPDVQAALLHRAGIFGRVLRTVEAYDRGQLDLALDLCEELGIPGSDLTQLYLESLAWANERQPGGDG